MGGAASPGPVLGPHYGQATFTHTLTDQIKFAPRLHRDEMVADDVKMPVAASVNVEYGESSFADYRVTADQRRHWTGVQTGAGTKSSSSPLTA